MPDIFKGKVLFCTGGGSGICKGMTYAVVSCLALPTPPLRPDLVLNRILGAADETRSQRRDRWKKVGASPSPDGLLIRF